MGRFKENCLVRTYPVFIVKCLATVNNSSLFAAVKVDHELAWFELAIQMYRWYLIRRQNSPRPPPGNKSVKANIYQSNSNVNFKPVLAHFHPDDVAKQNGFARSAIGTEIRTFRCSIQADTVAVHRHRAAFTTYQVSSYRTGSAIIDIKVMRIGLFLLSLFGSFLFQVDMLVANHLKRRQLDTTGRQAIFT